MALCALSLCWPTGAQAARPLLLWSAPKSPQSEAQGTAAGQLEVPRGIGVDPVSGDIFLADEEGNARIDKFSPWGEFLLAWGWGVRNGAPELQSCGPQATPPIKTCQAGIAGAGTGQLGAPYGVAVDGAGHVFVDEPGSYLAGGKGRHNLRVQEFDTKGKFELAFGGDVVAHGPDNSSNDEVQEVRIAASAGTFKLSFENPFVAEEVAPQTAALPFNATPTEVKNALEGLSTIGGLGGSVSVSGGPGSPSGSAPYQVTFEGNLGGDDVPQLGLEASGLKAPGPGAQLSCSTTTKATTISYQWLRNGAPIGGATSPTYTATAADEGKALQCQVFAIDANAGSTQIAKPAQVIAPEPATAPPTAPSMGAPSSNGALTVGGPVGQLLTCNTGSWGGSPSFAYQWYRNGVAIGGATSSTYTVSAGDLTSAAAFQCEVIGTNAGGSVARVSENLTTSPAPSPAAPSANATMAAPSAASTAHEGGAAEICKAVDTCKAGDAGGAAGQFNLAPSPAEKIAIDPKDEKVLVGDRERIEEFGANGAYAGSVALPSEEIAQSLSVDGDGNLYVGIWDKHGELDEHAGVVDKLSPGGTVLRAYEVKQGSPAVPAPEALAADGGGDLYAVAQRGPQTSQFPGLEARVVEFGADGTQLIPTAQEEKEELELEQKEKEGKEIGEAERPFAMIRGATLAGLAVSEACGIEGHDLYVSGFVPGKLANLRAFGPPPDPAVCPPPKVAPSIADQYALSAGSDSAVVGAAISPHFWPDTTYSVQYGTGKCSEGGCGESAPASPVALGERTTDEAERSAGIALAGLQPETTYHFRFVAESSGGGPSYGIDPDGTGPEEASEGEGLEGIFTTGAAPPAPKTDCPNQAFRTGPSAFLADCRAYEMVSPVDKNDGDIVTVGNIRSEPSALDQSAVGGGKLTYSAFRAFGDAQGAPFSVQYMATRGGAGWSNHAITPPRGVNILGIGFSLDSEFRAFSADLCQGWLLHDTDPPLTAGAVEGYPNLYRRQNCGEEGYEALSTAQPHNLEPESFRSLDLQGISADGRYAAFRVNDALTADANTEAKPQPGKEGTDFQCYEAAGGELRLLSVLPNGTASKLNCSLGTANTTSFYREAEVTGALSEDGSRAYWTASGDDSGPGKIYLRENPFGEGGECSGPAAPCTVKVSGLLGGEPGARFLAAAADGSKAIFEVEEPLSALNGNLYRYDAGAGTTTLIAQKAIGLLGASDDLSRFYFASSKALAGGASEGKPNLYLREGSQTRFVATLSGADAKATPDQCQFCLSPLADIPTHHTAGVSGDGQSAVFMSSAPLTGFENTDAHSGQADAEVYLYEADAEGGAGRLLCISCTAASGVRPSHGRELFPAKKPSGVWAAAQIPAAESQLHAPRVVSADGSRAFFQSFEPLVARDTNGRGDVYEWERSESAAGCQAVGAETYAAAAGGCISLISSGQSPSDSALMDTSADGTDVFFTTASSLLPQDPGLIDVYDARAGGGFPPPPPPPAECEGEACQSPPPPPAEVTPASAALAGKGNLTKGKAKKAHKHKRRHKGRRHAHHHHRKRRGK